MRRNEGSSLQQAIGAAAEAETMDTDAAAAIWKEIEASERYVTEFHTHQSSHYINIWIWCCICSYLVCSMYEEAAQLASSVLERLRHSHHDIDRDDMLESSAMVLLQAFNQLPSKTPHILNQLTLYFVSPKAIPSRLLLTGSLCFLAFFPSTTSCSVTHVLFFFFFPLLLQSLFSNSTRFCTFRSTISPRVSQWMDSWTFTIFCCHYRGCK